jgi:hypothetical protein
VSAQALISEVQRAELARYGNPYLFLELEEARDWDVLQPEQRLANFQNPYLYEDEAEVSGDPLVFAGASHTINKRSDFSEADLEILLDDVLRLYRPFVARSQWIHVKEYRSEFLKEASRDANRLRKVVDGLRSLKFQLLPGEKVECNRAPAEGIIAELKRLLY